VIIEYDGVQHSKPVPIFGGEEGLRETQRRDGFKNEYCDQNHIDMIRIPYTEYNNIADILNKEV
jgi:hypothetical protein